MQRAPGFACVFSMRDMLDAKARAACRRRACGSMPLPAIRQSNLSKGSILWDAPSCETRRAIFAGLYVGYPGKELRNRITAVALVIAAVLVLAAIGRFTR